MRQSRNVLSPLRQHEAIASGAYGASDIGADLARSLIVLNQTTEDRLDRGSDRRFGLGGSGVGGGGVRGRMYDEGALEL